VVEEGKSASEVARNLGIARSLLQPRVRPWLDGLPGRDARSIGPMRSRLWRQLEHRIPLGKRNEFFDRRVCGYWKESLNLSPEGVKVGFEDRRLVASLNLPKLVTICRPATPERDDAAGLRVAYPLRMAARSNQETVIAERQHVDRCRVDASTLSPAHFEQVEGIRR
jgi:hypothetical protein